MKKKNIISIVTISVIAISLLCFNAYAQSKSEVEFIRITSSAAGGMWYTTGAKIAALITQKIPGVRSEVAIGGSTRNITLVNRGEAEMGFSMPGLASYAYHGTGDYKNRSKKNLRYIGNTTSGPIWFVCRKDLPITNVTQFVDKRFAVGQKGWYSTKLILAILKTMGITPEKVKEAGGMIHYVGAKNIPTMMQDGHLDCMVYSSAPPNPLHLAIGENPGVRYIELTDEQIDNALKDPYVSECFKDIVPKGTYKELTKDHVMISKGECLICNANLPEDLVYQITKIIYESPELKKLLKGWKAAFNPNMAMKGNTVPLHPGAKRYFKEKNIPIVEGKL